MAACAVSTLAVGVLACEPRIEEGLSAVGVAVATDEVGSRALAGHGVEVRWLTCKANVARQSSTPSRPSFANVDCEGRTRGGEHIRVKGKVTDERTGPCIHGDLTAEVAGRTVFRAEVLGDCGRTPTASDASSTPGPLTPEPQLTGSGTSPLSPEAQPTVTETVTVTPEAQPTVTETVTVTPEPQPTRSESGNPTADPRATHTPEPSTGTPSPEPSASGSAAASPSPSCSCGE